MQTTDRNLQIFIDKYTIDKSTEDQSKTEFCCYLGGQKRRLCRNGKVELVTKRRC